MRKGTSHGPSRHAAFVMAVASAAVWIGCEGGPAGPDADSTARQPSGPAPPPSTGSILVATVTVGGGIDAAFNTYTIKFGRDRVAAVGPNSSIRIGGLSEGAYSVGLVDLSNCQVLGNNPRGMNVVPGRVTRETFRVHC